MRMRAGRSPLRNGNSLIEVTIALTVLAITVLGAAYYRYLTTLDILRAHNLSSGADLAIMFIETWQGTGGSESFDPASELAGFLDISAAAGGAVPGGCTLLGTYDINVAGRTYQATLHWRDPEAGLRELGAAVSWPSGKDQSRAYQLTTYVRR